MTKQEILLIDDSADDAELFCIAAKAAAMPCPIRIARSGEEALDLLFKQGIQPALILLDIKMPGINGLEVLRQVRADPAHRATIVVMLTGSNLDSDRAEAASLGCSLFLTKPIAYADCVEMARRIKSLLPE